MKLGDRVRCTGYIKKSGNWYEMSEDRQTCSFCHKDGEPEEVDGLDWCDRFETVQKEFTGIFVGTKREAAVLVARYEEGEYVRSGYYISKDIYKEFAVVYYAENRKHLVPMDMIEEAVDGEA